MASQSVGKTSRITEVKRNYALLLAISDSNRSDSTKHNMITGEHARMSRDSILNQRTILYVGEIIIMKKDNFNAPVYYLVRIGAIFSFFRIKCLMVLPV